MNNVQIQFENVSMSYCEPDEILYKGDVLSNITIQIRKGEFVAVIGSNGSGKSTFAKLTNGILYPTKGRVYVNGLDTSLPENEITIRKSCGLVFQNPDNQLVASIVEEDVAFGPENLGIPPKEIRTRVDDALKAVGMYEYRLHETHRLSGGQKQRVAIAGIIAMQPECIVLDEPTAMLDPQGRRDVRRIIRKLNRENGITVILITHFMEEAVEADRVILIDQSRIVGDGTPYEIFSDTDLLERSKLSIPEPTQLFCKLRSGGLELPGLPLTEEQFADAFESIINTHNGEKNVTN